MADLLLYTMDYCPYCIKVDRYLESRAIKVKQKKLNGDQAVRAELLALSGRTQVPCLSIDGRPLLESDDIIQWFRVNWK